MDNLKIAQEWFDIAKMDISSAKYLQNILGKVDSIKSKNDSEEIV